MLDLAERTIVVAGAGGGGIGTAVCRLLVDCGALVVALDRDPDRLELAASLSSRVEPRGCDLRDPNQVETALDGIARIDGLVHVAGGMRLDQWAPTASVPLDTFDDIVTLNLRAALVISQSVAARMIRQGAGGSIVYLSSIAALQALPFGAAYAAAKAALLSLTRTQAVEWGRRGIRVNAVAAGTVRTPKNTSRVTEATDIDSDARIPIRRRATPEDVAGPVAFLLSDLAACITGHTLVVDGGASVVPSYLDADLLPVYVTDIDLRARLRGQRD